MQAKPELKDTDAELVASNAPSPKLLDGDSVCDRCRRDIGPPFYLTAHGYVLCRMCKKDMFPLTCWRCLSSIREWGGAKDDNGCVPCELFVHQAHQKFDNPTQQFSLSLTNPKPVHYELRRQWYEQAQHFHSVCLRAVCSVPLLFGNHNNIPGNMVRRLSSHIRRFTPDAWTTPMRASDVVQACLDMFTNQVQQALQEALPFGPAYVDAVYAFAIEHVIPTIFGVAYRGVLRYETLGCLAIIPEEVIQLFSHQAGHDGVPMNVARFNHNVMLAYCKRDTTMAQFVQSTAKTQPTILSLMRSGELSKSVNTKLSAFVKSIAALPCAAKSGTSLPSSSGCVSLSVSSLSALSACSVSASLSCTAV